MEIQFSGFCQNLFVGFKFGVTYGMGLIADHEFSTQNYSFSLREPRDKGESGESGESGE